MVSSSHMKTTVEIAPALLARAKKLAAQRQTTLRALIEAGLVMCWPVRAGPGGGGTRFPMLE